MQKKTKKTHNTSKIYIVNWHSTSKKHTSLLYSLTPGENFSTDLGQLQVIHSTSPKFAKPLYLEFLTPLVIPYGFLNDIFRHLFRIIKYLLRKRTSSVHLRMLSSDQAHLCSFFLHNSFAANDYIPCLK